MNGIDIGNLGRADDRSNVQIAARALGRTDADSFVGKPHVQAVLVGFRVHRDRLYPEILARADDANSDLASIGDEYLLKHISAAESRKELRRIPPAGRFPSASP